MTTTDKPHYRGEGESGHPRLALAVPAVRKRSRRLSDHLLEVHARPAVHGAAQVARQRLEQRGVDRRATRQDAVKRVQAEPCCATKCQRAGSRRRIGNPDSVPDHPIPPQRHLGLERARFDRPRLVDNRRPLECNNLLHIICRWCAPTRDQLLVPDASIPTESVTDCRGSCSCAARRCPTLARRPGT